MTHRGELFGCVTRSDGQRKWHVTRVSIGKAERWKIEDNGLVDRLNDRNAHCLQSEWPNKSSRFTSSINVAAAAAEAEKSSGVSGLGNYLCS